MNADCCTCFRAGTFRALVAVLLMVACRPPVDNTRSPASVAVRSEVAEAGPFQARLDLLGKVVPAMSVPLLAPYSGKVLYPPRFASGLRTGEPVARGELLFTIDNEEVRLRLAEAELTAQLAETELERTRQGVEGGFLSAAELKRREIDAELAAERLRSARLRNDRLGFHAPRSGHLLIESVVPPGSEIAGDALRVGELAGDGLPRVEAWAAAADLERLRPELEVRLIQPGEERVLGHGVVGEVARQVDRSGTVRLVVSVLQDLGLPSPGEGVELEVLLDARSGALTLPREALIVDGGVTSVFVLDPSGSGYRARSRLVKSGGASGGRVEILDGLKEGERVAVRGAEFLADGLPAAEADAGADPGG